MAEITQEQVEREKLFELARSRVELDIADVVRRLEAYSAVTESGCWVWQRPLKNGYGEVSIRNRCRKAHRVAYQLLVGPIPDGLSLDHLCRNRACINPAHLEPVTNRVNVLRGVGPTAANAAATHCGRGHALTPDNLRQSALPWRLCLTCDRDRKLRRKANIAEAMWASREAAAQLREHGRPAMSFASVQALKRLARIAERVRNDTPSEDVVASLLQAARLYAQSIKGEDHGK